MDLSFTPARIDKLRAITDAIAARISLGVAGSLKGADLKGTYLALFRPVLYRAFDGAHEI